MQTANRGSDEGNNGREVITQEDIDRRCRIVKKKFPKVDEQIIFDGVVDSSLRAVPMIISGSLSPESQDHYICQGACWNVINVLNSIKKLKAREKAVRRPESCDDGVNPLELLLREENFTERRRRLAKAREVLSSSDFHDQQIDAFFAMYFENRSRKELAAACKKTPGTIGQWHRMCLDCLIEHAEELCEP
jgi:hypothetical protein